MPDSRMIDYYSRRAPEYDRIYERPERQRDLGRLRQTVASWLAGRRVLELACGTGWWTDVVAGSARQIVATDVSEEVLAVARGRRLPEERVSFRIADAHDPGSVSGSFDAVLAGFWISHVRRAELPAFLDRVDRRVGDGGRVVLLDNRWVEGSSTPIARTDEAGDTFQIRPLEGGEAHEVRKNFLEEAELRELLRGRASTVDLRLLTHYWALAYDVARS